MRDRPRMSRMHRISNVRVYLVFHTLYHLVFKICVYRSTNGSRMMIKIGLAKFFGRFPPGILYGRISWPKGRKTPEKKGRMGIYNWIIRSGLYVAFNLGLVWNVLLDNGKFHNRINSSRCCCISAKRPCQEPFRIGVNRCFAGIVCRYSQSRRILSSSNHNWRNPEEDNHSPTIE